ncbi:uncharacterized protein LOC143470216 [Clavelina lepadiformis]|uniref:uncharacterized protein LOC143470216 n=1 Tax=Clavelina lepadiformis TaxID=159417 RepID=UPI00404262B1
MSEKSPNKRSSTTFSESEEEVIGKFLLSCWSKKLRIPHKLLYGALKQHLDKYPRTNRSKNNQVSHIWRLGFFVRHPHVEEAYKSFKSSSDSRYDVVSRQLLNSFIADLACVDKPPLQEIKVVKSNARDKDSTQSDVSLPKSPQKKDNKKTLPTLDSTQSSSVKDRSSDSGGRSAKHYRSRTEDGRRKAAAQTLKTRSPSLSPKSVKSAARKSRGRKSLGSLKLSSTLFKAAKSKVSSSTSEVDLSNMSENTKQTDQSETGHITDGTISSSTTPAITKKSKPVTPTVATDSTKPKSLVKKKPLAVTTPGANRKSMVPADAVPLEEIKFEEGANIEAMDCSKWYKAKIVEVYEDKQEVLVHFNGWGKRFDTLFPMSSNLIRGSTTVEKKVDVQKFNVGDDVLSQWSDGNFYPGTVLSIKETGSYVVMYYDGLKKVVRPNLLKKMTEKEKDAAMKTAQTTYLMSLSTRPVDSPQQATTIAKNSSYRRYKTSANDREKRIAARKDGSANYASPASTRKARKRKIEETATPTSTTTSPVRTTSPTQTGNFQAKQARLDKITGTLLDKAVTTIASTTTTVSTQSTSSFSPATTNLSFTSAPMHSITTDEVGEEKDIVNMSSSDDSDSPLIIDEDGDSKPVMKKHGTSVPSSRKKKKTTNITKTTGSQISNEDANVSSVAVQEDMLENIKKAEMSEKATSNTPCSTRQEAGEALLQLSQSTSTVASGNTAPITSSAYEAESTLFAVALDNLKETTLKAIDPKTMVLPERLDAGFQQYLKEDISLKTVVEKLDVNISKLREHVSSKANMIVASSETLFMSTMNEDNIVNWIHDMTDYGWGIDCLQISLKIKSFLSHEAYSVMFDDDLPINQPSEKWIEEFLERHPEIFPGREQPLSRFQLDRNGFQDWLSRWLSTVQSANVVPNAVYYCDETVWDTTQGPLHNVQFSHKSIALNNISSSSKITTLTCVGADGSVTSPVHIFPDNIGTKISQDKLFTNSIGFTSQGLSNSGMFLYWLKNCFLKKISTKKRPLALLVDSPLEMLDFATLNFAEHNKIILFRFLPSAAHFVQHPDQKLFGRLRIQWKKSVFTKFMVENSGKQVSTHAFANCFKQEFLKVATPSTIKMCFELTKLYSPMPESTKASREKRNKSKSSKPLLHVEENERMAQDVDEASMNSSYMESESDKSLESEDKTEDLQNEPKSDAETAKQLAEMKKSRSGTRTRISLSQSEPSVPEQRVASQAGPKYHYKKGDLVLAKWSDCKLYSATVLKRIDAVTYKIRYYDGLVKVVNDDFLRPWKNVAPVPLAAVTPSAKITESLEVKAIDIASGKIKPRIKSCDVKTESTKGLGSIMAAKRRHTLQSPSENRRRYTSDTVAQSEGTKFSTRSRTTSISDAVLSTYVIKRVEYKKGEQVLCRWTDRRLYPARILKQTDTDHYLVEYYDLRKKNVHHTWLSSWKPPPHVTQVTTKEPIVKKVQKVSETAQTTSSTISSEESPVNDQLATDKDKTEIKTADNKEIPASDDTEAPDKPQSSRETDKIKSDESGTNSLVQGEDFSEGDTVLARWTDCRSYPATVLNQVDDGQFVVQYYDGMTRTLKKEMLKKWDPNAAPKDKPRMTQSRRRTTNGNKATNKADKRNEEIVKNEPLCASKSIGGKPSLTAFGQPKAYQSYEAYYSKLIQESELHKFKCRVPGCNKVFRTEATLKQHHKHYHLQRYKLRDQETQPPQKRRTSKDVIGGGAAKRRVSSDYYSSPKSTERKTPTPPPSERSLRSRGGKPPIDVYRKQQCADASFHSSNQDETSSAEDKSLLSPDEFKRGEPYVALDRTSVPTKKRRLRSNSGASRQSYDSASESKAGNIVKEQQSREVEREDAEEKKVEVVNEDVIRCICGDEEEQGFMMQCDACLTWQHGACEGVLSPQRSSEEDKIPENATQPDYICKICRDPPGGRESQKYLYNNDFLTKGKLPSLLDSDSSDGEKSKKDQERETNFEKIMMASHQVMEELMKMQEALHSIKLKIDISNPDKNHPMLHMWKETNLADGATVFDGKQEENDKVTTETMTNNGDRIIQADSKQEASKSPDSPVSSVVRQTVDALVTDTAKAVSPSYLRSGRHVEKSDDEKSDSASDKSCEKMDVDVKTDLTTQSIEKKRICDDEQTVLSNGHDAEETDLWKPIEINRSLRPVLQGPSRRVRKPEDYQEEITLRCRGNLLHHIHKLEDSISERLTQLESYVNNVENAFQKHVRSSPSSGSISPLSDGRLGELQDGLGVIHTDIDSVYRLLASPTSSV